MNIICHLWEELKGLETKEKWGTHWRDIQICKIIYPRDNNGCNPIHYLTFVHSIDYLSSCLIFILTPMMQQESTFAFLLIKFSLLFTPLTFLLSGLHSIRFIINHSFWETTSSLIFGPPPSSVLSLCNGNWKKKNTDLI